MSDEAVAAVLHEKQGRTGFITLNRPPLNILNISALDAMQKALADLLSGEGVDVVVLRGAGARAFCAGADVADHMPEVAPRMLSAFHQVARQLQSMEAVSVAAVHGLALGGGMELALCCDIVVAAESAEFGQPEIHVGAFPPVAAVILPGRIGRPRASDMILTGRRMAAYEALACGLVSRLVPDAEFAAEVDNVLAALTSNSAPVMRRTVRAIRGTQSTDFSAALARAEKIYTDELLTLADAREGVAAFLEKRRPRWTNR